MLSIAECLERSKFRINREALSPADVDVADVDVGNRWDFARPHKGWIISDWEGVGFSNETTVNRFNSNGRIGCWVLDKKNL